MTAIVDTGVLLSLFDVSDAWHQRSVQWIREAAGELVVPAPILGELAHFLERHGDERTLVGLAEWLLQHRVRVESLLPQDLRRLTVLLPKYPQLGFVDAAMVAIAERLLIDTIATTDRRHFGAIRPGHVERFVLVP